LARWYRSSPRATGENTAQVKKWLEEQSPVQSNAEVNQKFKSKKFKHVSKVEEIPVHRVLAKAESLKDIK
jgi:hypothetical protein